MCKPVLDVVVPGRAATLTDPKTRAEPWKQAVAGVVGHAWHGGYLATPCAVDLTFRLARSPWQQPALVNLLKATIDGMSAVLFAPARGPRPGAWDRQDWWITTLTARRELVDGPSEVRIQVGEARPDREPPPGMPLCNGWVDLRPPLWATPTATTVCYDAYRRALEGAPPVPAEAAIGVDLSKP